METSPSIRLSIPSPRLLAHESCDPAFLPIYRRRYYTEIILDRVFFGYISSGQMLKVNLCIEPRWGWSTEGLGMSLAAYQFFLLIYQKVLVRCW